MPREEANCNCEVISGSTECSTGPHLHLEVRETENTSIDLNDMIIGDFVIHTGTESYDLGCRRYLTIILINIMDKIDFILYQEPLSSNT